MDLEINGITYIHIADIEDDEYGLISHYTTLYNQDFFFDIVLIDDNMVFQMFDDDIQIKLCKKYFNIDSGDLIF